MNETLRYILISYIAVISLISAVVCIADKHNSKIKGRRRVPEKTLLLLSALGGSAAMLIVMLLIRHKTLPFFSAHFTKPRRRIGHSTARIASPITAAALSGKYFPGSPAARFTVIPYLSAAAESVPKDDASSSTGV